MTTTLTVPGPTAPINDTGDPLDACFDAALPHFDDPVALASTGASASAGVSALVGASD